MILIISAVFSPEPVVSAQLSYDLACELSKNNKITVLCPKPSRPIGFDFSREDVNVPYKIIKVDSFTSPENGVFGRMRESWSFGLHCRKYISATHSEIDIMYINAWPLLSQYYIINTAKKYKIKVVTHVQDLYPESLSNKLPSIFKSSVNWCLMPVDKYILRNSFHIVAISETMKRILSKTRQISPGKISVVCNWQDESVFISFQKTIKEPLISGKFVFMYLGNIGPVAGVELLIESFAEANIENSTLVIAGSG